MKKIILSAFLLILSFTSYAQLYKKHDWNSKPIFYKLTDEEKKLSSIALKEKYLIQYYKTVLGSSYKLFETKHSIIRVNDDKGIEMHNRVYIPMRSVKKVINIKARVLQENGNIKTLDKNNIKELSNVKNYGNFKIFAIEGVTKNSQLEFIYTLEKNITAVGSIIVQKEYQVRETEVIIRKPSHLGSRIMEYNGFPKMTKKIVEGNKEAFTATSNDIKAMIKEASASPEANRMKVSYQIAPSFISNSEMWQNLGSNIQENYIQIKPKKYKALINDYLKFSKEKKADNNAEIINNICEYVNSNFNIIRTQKSELNNLKTIIQKKQATESGIIKVYSTLLNYEQIDFEFVLTSDRFDHKFDPSFYSNINLQYALLYFPKEKKYIEPDYVNTRLGFAPTKTISNHGIFISPYNFKFKKIDIPNENDTKIKRDFILSVDIENIKTSVECFHELTGYRAYNSRGAYKYLKNKDLNEYKNFSATSGIDDANFEYFEVENESFTLNTDNIPFKLNYKYTTESLIEELGEDMVLNFGKVIGTQSEFYQEVERVNPVELIGLIKYEYLIKIEVPKGYIPKGLENIKIDEKLELQDEIACSFQSDYFVEGNNLYITVTETYNKLKIDLDGYDGYKNVVNAAFDFSKKGVLLEKQ